MQPSNHIKSKYQYILHCLNYICSKTATKYYINCKKNSYNYNFVNIFNVTTNFSYNIYLRYSTNTRIVIKIFQVQMHTKKPVKGSRL